MLPAIVEMATEGLPRGRQKVEVADIFREHGNDYRSRHALPLSHLKVIHAIEACRTAHLGGHVEKCDSCGSERISYNSCCNRHCPKCQTLTKEKWLEDRKAELLPVNYFHNVFTLPHDLNPVALCNTEVVYELLFRAAGDTLQEFGSDPKHLGGKIGFIAILHTWDQTLRSHVHLHVVIPAGALSFDGSRWIHPKSKNFLFPVKALSRVFRGKFIDHLGKAYSNGRLIFPGNTRNLGTQEGFKGLLDTLWKTDWVVYSKKPFAGPEQVLNYLGRYTHRVAISNHRILSIENGRVTFTYRDRRDGDKVKRLTLEAQEFIRRFLLHVLPIGFMRIRHFGFLANRIKSRNIRRCREFLGDTQKPPERTEGGPLELLRRLTGIDLTKCPSCKNGTMVLVMELPGPSPYRRRRQRSTSACDDSS
jgi:hypothetical protein